MAEALRDVGFEAQKPKGSFYLYVRAPKGVEGGPSFSRADEFSEFLIREKLVSTVPWDDVGAFIRFSATFVAPSEEEERRIINEVKERLGELGLVFSPS